MECKLCVKVDRPRRNAQNGVWHIVKVAPEVLDEKLRRSGGGPFYWAGTISAPKTARGLSVMSMLLIHFLLMFFIM